MVVAGKAGIDGDQWAQCVQGRGWLWNAAAGAVKTAEPATLILAHGAGAPMDSDWMTGMAERLAARGLNVLRFEFPYMAHPFLDVADIAPLLCPDANIREAGLDDWINHFKLQVGERHHAAPR